eukprot:1153895-Pelagomonas_calceolata.AAC.2
MKRLVAIVKAEKLSAASQGPGDQQCEQGEACSWFLRSASSVVCQMHHPMYQERSWLYVPKENLSLLTRNQRSDALASLCCLTSPPASAYHEVEGQHVCLCYVINALMHLLLCVAPTSPLQAHATKSKDNMLAGGENRTT